MDEPLAVALKFGFLAVLYLFLLWVARSAMRDLARYGGTPAAAEPVETPGPRPRERSSGDALRSGLAPRIQVVAAMGHEPGTVFEVSDGATFGRSDSAEIRVDDPFASSAHARVFSRNGYMYIEDLGSTNGTYLNGRQLKKAERLGMADTIRIGDSEYRYEE
jgi:pSer/pThr/pTyr-binding forkhead associated (FHA) protein